jgi:hypothetical protein
MAILPRRVHIKVPPSQEDGMAPRVIKLREQETPAEEPEPEVFSQRKRPEVGRFWLQVDRQTKGSYETGEAAEKAGMVIKNGHPLVQVSVYDTVESVNKILKTS